MTSCIIIRETNESWKCLYFLHCSSLACVPFNNEITEIVDKSPSKNAVIVTGFIEMNYFIEIPQKIQPAKKQKPEKVFVFVKSSPSVFLCVSFNPMLDGGRSYLRLLEMGHFNRNRRTA